MPRVHMRTCGGAWIVRASAPVLARHGRCARPREALCVRMQALMLVMECARGVPQFWGSERLRSMLPPSLLESLDLQEPRSIRLTVHHGFLPLVRSCPPEAAEQWLAAAFAQFLQLLGNRLHGAWPGLVARVKGEVGEAKAKQTEEEMVQEVLRPLPATAPKVCRWPQPFCCTGLPRLPQNQRHSAEHGRAAGLILQLPEHGTHTTSTCLLLLLSAGSPIPHDPPAHAPVHLHDTPCTTEA